MAIKSPLILVFSRKNAHKIPITIPNLKFTSMRARNYLIGLRMNLYGVETLSIMLDNFHKGAIIVSETPNFNHIVDISG